MYTYTIDSGVGDTSIGYIHVRVARHRVAPYEWAAVAAAIWCACEGAKFGVVRYVMSTCAADQTVLESLEMNCLTSWW